MMEKKLMIDNGIYILSGAIQSGKTTTVYNWLRYKQSVGGFLTPDVDALRYLFLLNEKKWLPFQTNLVPNKAALCSIGKYNFYNEAFMQMERTLENDLLAEKEWIVIDELGRLEVNGEGLAPVATRVINQVLAQQKNKLLLIVRTDLLEKVVDFFSIKSYHSLTVSDIRDLI